MKKVEREYLQSLKDKWPSAFVVRSEIDRFSGGLLHGRTLANLDCEGKGPKRIRLGRKIGYQIDDLITWMTERVEILK